MAVRKPTIVHDLYLRLGRLVIEAGLARIDTHQVNSLETTPRTRRTDEHPLWQKLAGETRRQRPLVG
jgi:hypothetical protein